MNFLQKKPVEIILAILLFVIIFHFCIVLKIIPYDITWGGRLKNDNEMYVFEAISIFINLFFAVILLMKGNYLAYNFPEKFINFSLWIFIVLFLINTFGNLIAKTVLEQFFAVLTLVLAFLTWKVVLK